jgi:hypothetical protein
MDNTAHAVKVDRLRVPLFSLFSLSLSLSLFPWSFHPTLLEKTDHCQIQRSSFWWVDEEEPALSFFISFYRLSILLDGP